MKVFLAADHAGFELKCSLVEYVRGLGHEPADLGAHEHAQGDDYPELIAPAAREIARLPEARAIVIGGSGMGEAIVANRFPNVRAALYYGGPLAIVRLAREHNDANILSLGARFLSPQEAEAAVRIFLETPFSGEERHARRVAQIEEMARPDF